MHEPVPLADDTRYEVGNRPRPDTAASGNPGHGDGRARATNYEEPGTAGTQLPADRRVKAAAHGRRRDRTSDKRNLRLPSSGWRIIQHERGPGTRLDSAPRTLRYARRPMVVSA